MTPSRDPIYSRPNHLRTLFTRVRTRTSLPLVTLLTTLSAIGFGLLIRFTSSEPWTARQLMYLEFPGQLYMRALGCLSVPILIASLVSAVANWHPKLTFRVGKRTILYYLGTSVVAIILGVLLVLILRPGVGGQRDQLEPSTPPTGRKVTSEDVLLDLLRNMIPKNLATAFFNQDATSLTPPPTNQTDSDISTWPIAIKQVTTTNFLGLIIISVVVGLFVGLSARSSARPLLRILANDLHELVQSIAGYILTATPIGVAFLVMPKIIEVQNIGEMLQTTGLFAVTVLLGLAIHGLVVLPAIYYLVTKKNPYHFLAQMSEALLVAFGTSSSVCTVPATMKCLEQAGAGLEANLIRVSVPIGANINLDGTALYEAVAAIFLAQLRSVGGMDLAKVLAVSITTTVAVAGSSGIPHAGIIILTMVLSSLGVPPEDLALVLAIDWLLHRFRTVVNVLGDTYGVAIVNHLSAEDFATFEDASSESSVVADVENQVVTKETPKAGCLDISRLSACPPYVNAPSSPSPIPGEYENEKITAVSFSRMVSL